MLLTLGGPLLAGSFFQIESLFRNIELVVGKFLRNSYYPSLIAGKNLIPKVRIYIALIALFVISIAGISIFKSEFLAENVISRLGVSLIGGSVLIRIITHFRFTEIKSLATVGVFTQKRTAFNVLSFASVGALYWGIYPFLTAINLWPLSLLQVLTRNSINNESPYNE